MLLSASSVQAAMKKLLELDLITQDAGFYTIPDRFLLLYIGRLVGMVSCLCFEYHSTSKEA